jgi:hypothetical protein
MQGFEAGYFDLATESLDLPIHRPGLDELGVGNLLRRLAQSTFHSLRHNSDMCDRGILQFLCIFHRGEPSRLWEMSANLASRKRGNRGPNSGSMASKVCHCEARTSW